MMIAMTKNESCATHGAYTSELLKSERLNLQRWTSCPACEREREQAEAARDAARRRETSEYTRNLRLDAAGIPPRYRNVTFEGFQAPTVPQQQALAAAREYATNFEANRAVGRSAVFSGLTGCGKTHLACACALHLFEAGYSVCYTTVTGLTRRLKATWGEHRVELEHEVLAQLHGCDLLILDEVGVQSNSDWERNHLFDLINERYNHLRPTIVISNLGLPEISKVLGERILDRLRQAGGRAIRFEWESHRKEAT